MCHEVSDVLQAIPVGALSFLPIPITHGVEPVYGWLIKESSCNEEKTFAYITDCNFIPEESKKKLIGVNYLVIDGLRERKHETHFTFEEAINFGIEIHAKKILLTHICHDFSHDEIIAKCLKLANNVLPAYDGLVIEL